MKKEMETVQKGIGTVQNDVEVVRKGVETVQKGIESTHIVVLQEADNSEYLFQPSSSQYQ
jgi:hypothetical protein